MQRKKEEAKLKVEQLAMKRRKEADERVKAKHAIVQ